MISYIHPLAEELGAYDQCVLVEELAAGKRPRIGVTPRARDVRLNHASAYVGLARSAIEQARCHEWEGGVFDRDHDGHQGWRELLREFDHELRSMRRTIWDLARTVDARGGAGSGRSASTVERCRDLAEEVLVGVRAMLATEAQGRAYAVELLRRDYEGLRTCERVLAAADLAHAA